MKIEGEPVNLDIGDSVPITTKLGDIMVDESRDILCIVNVAPDDEEDNVPLVKFTIQFIDVLTSEIVTTEFVCTTNRHAINEPLIRNVLVDKQLNRLKTTDAIEKSLGLANDDDLEQVRNILDVAIKEIESSVSGNDPFCEFLVSDLKQIKDTMQNRSTFKSIGDKKSNWIADAHKKQRKAGGKGGAYETKMKKEMISKYEGKNDKESKSYKKEDDSFSNL